MAVRRCAVDIYVLMLCGHGDAVAVVHAKCYILRQPTNTRYFNLHDH